MEVLYIAMKKLKIKINFFTRKSNYAMIPVFESLIVKLGAKL